MAFIMEKILSNAQKLSSRLREHDGSTDHLVELMTALNKKIDSMKTFQDNLPDLAEMALCKPRSTVKLGLSQENSQIRELEQENKELKQSLEEHELALELIMSKYRQRVTKLLKAKQVNESIHHKETVQSQELQDKTERINEMGKMMWKAVADDGQPTYNSQQLLTQLRIENNGIRELISIACNSGNSLKAINRYTQTDDNARSPRRDSWLSSSYLFDESGRSDAAAKPNLNSPYSEISGCANSTTLVSTREFTNSKVASYEPSISLNSQKPPVRVTSRDDRILFSETCAAPMSVCGNKPVQSLARGVVLPDVVTSRSYSPNSNKEQKTFNLGDSSSPDAHAKVESRLSENQILNHSNFLNCQTDVNSPTAISDTLAATSNSDTNHALKASHTLNVNTGIAASVLPPKQHGSSGVCTNETSIHQQDLTGYENPARVGSSPVNPSPPDDSLAQKNATTSSAGRTASKLEHVTVTTSNLHLKTPGQSSVINDGASIATGIEHSLSLAPSVRSGKTATALHAIKATPVRIKAMAKHPSVFSVIAAAADSRPQTGTASSPTIGAMSSALLDSNGNDSHSSVPN